MSKLFKISKIEYAKKLHCFSDDSYTVEWESHVSRDGSLFYLEYNIQPAPTTPSIVGMPEKSHSIFPWRNDFKRTSTRRSKKAGIRLRSLINGNRKSHENAMKKKLSVTARKVVTGNRNEAASNDRDTTNKVKFSEMAEGEVKEITVFIDPSRRLKYGRRTSVAEALLGVSVCPFPNSSRIMIAGYMPNSEISQIRAIKIGDWLKAINNQDVNVENFELILLSFTQPTYIKLYLQRIAVEEPPQHQPNIGKVTNTTEFVDALRSFFPAHRHHERDKTPIFSLLLLSLRDTGEQSADGEDVIFSYPAKQSNYLYRIRGTFLTMNSLFRECTFNSKPKISCVTIQSVEYYVSYYSSSDGKHICDICIDFVDGASVLVKTVTIYLLFFHFSFTFGGNARETDIYSRCQIQIGYACSMFGIFRTFIVTSLLYNQFVALQLG